jgi:intraflagellar transport protein 172
MKPHLISVRIGEASTPLPLPSAAADDTKTPLSPSSASAAAVPVKRIAYLLDAQAIRVVDLSSSSSSLSAADGGSLSAAGAGGGVLLTINHEYKIDWLELNPRGTKLLFRDKRRALHLVDVASGQRVTLLHVCHYVQWVPDSDVVVAQSRLQVLVWYSLERTDQFVSIAVKGEVEDIERAAGMWGSCGVVMSEEGVICECKGREDDTCYFSSLTSPALLCAANRPNAQAAPQFWWTKARRTALSHLMRWMRV